MDRQLLDLERRVRELERVEVQNGLGARVYNDANISVGNGAFATLTFNQERWDSGSFHSTSVNTSRLTAPVAGRYLVCACIRFAANVTGNRQIRIMVDGGTEVARVSQQAVQGGITTIMEVQTISEVGAGNYFTIEAFQDSGGALNVEATGNSSPEFWIQGPIS